MYNGVVDGVLLEAAAKAKIDNIVEKFLPKDGSIMWVDPGEVEGESNYAGVLL